MPTGSGLGSLIPVALSLVGIFTVLRARARRRKGPMPDDEALERRQVAAAEMERRMASYLAQGSLGGALDAGVEGNRQENGR
jgi:hypothetical protein